MSDEEYVREAWEMVHTGAAALHLSDYSSPIVIAGNELSNWAEARQFTEQRIEEVRQLREDVALVSRDSESVREMAVCADCRSNDEWAIELHRWCRILARLEELLAAKSAGLSAKALEGK